MHERKELSDWFRSAAGKENSQFCITPKDAPERWKMQTVDTGRYADFRWRGMECRIVPDAESTDALFEMAMKALNKYAVACNFLLNNYEISAERGFCLSVDVPLQCL